MPRKNWLGADLIFDLDASHREHDPEGKDCGKFTCSKCLSHVKGQTVKLIEEFLVPDFGFSKNEISVNFSGNRGYHVHVVNKDVLPLGRDERREMVDYITGTGLQYERFFYKDGKKNVGPKPDDGGYHGKFSREIIRLLADKEFAGHLNRKLRKEETLARFIEGIRAGNWDRVRPWWCHVLLSRFCGRQCQRPISTTSHPVEIKPSISDSLNVFELSLPSLPTTSLKWPCLAI